MTTVKGYQLIKKLGEGGMAAVYLAKEEGLDREVALKILTLKVSDETFKKSFLSEARLVAKLEHPHIIKIYRVNVDNNQFYMEMELLRGGTLKERLEKSTLGMPAILSIIKQMASALSYAHKKGYIHRDIKPANILFRNDGEAVLADFGIAKLEDVDSDLTVAGHSGFGTPNYMAPEQARGEKVDCRADMYSLGIVFYEMLTQQKPFKASNTAAIIHKHMTAEIPRLPSVYEYLQPILDKVLSKDKEERYADMQAFLDALMHVSSVHSMGDETRPYFNNDRTVPYPNNDLTRGSGTQTQGNVTKPWNVYGQASSEILVISFIDIVDSTKLSDKYGDIVFSSDIRQNFERIIKENMQDSNEGMLIKFLGDGVMLIYSDPVYAIENSLRIQKSVEQFLEQGTIPKFLLRVGLNIGNVTLENAGRIDVQGIHVNKAQRIEGQCKPGLVAISRSIYDMAYPRLKHRSNLFWKDIGDKKLKGIPDKERVYLVSSNKISTKIKYHFLYGLLMVGLVLGSYMAYIKYDTHHEAQPVKPMQSTLTELPQEIRELVTVFEEFEKDSGMLDEVTKMTDLVAKKYPDHEKVEYIAQRLDDYKQQQQKRLLSELSAINIRSTKENAKSAVSALSDMPKITISVKNKAYIHCLYQAPASTKNEAMMRLYPFPEVWVSQLPSLKQYQAYKKRNKVKMPIGEELSGIAKIHCFTTTKMIKKQYFSLFDNNQTPLLKNDKSLDDVRSSIAEFTDGIYKEVTFEQRFQ